MTFFCFAGANPNSIRRKIIKHLKHSSSNLIPWLFLGSNYLLFRKWKDALGPGWSHLSYSKKLQRLAFEWRQPYLAWLTQLGKQNNNLVWWSSMISERNTYADSLYHSICYLRIGLDFLEQKNLPQLVVVESRAVLYVLAKHAALQGRVRIFHTYMYLVKDVLKWSTSWASFLLSGLCSILDAYITRKKQLSIPCPTEKPRVLIHSCIDDSFLGDDGTEHDRYFGALASELRIRGYDVMTMPWLFNLKRSRRKAFVWFRQNPHKYLIPEDYYSVYDYAWAAMIIVRQIFLLPGHHNFQNMNITSLVREACWKQSYRSGAAKFVIYYRLIKKLAQSGMKLDFFIDTFENMITEKPQVMAFRKWMPEVTTVGFQHFLELYPLFLCWITSLEEAEVAPHPDVIVCNSLHMLKRMEEIGFPRNKLRVGPSLRYQNMIKEFVSINTEPNKVLVIMPLSADHIIEMMDLLRQSFPVPENIEFWLKPHPMLSRKILHEAIGKLLSHFSIIEGNIDQWLPRATCAVVMASTSAFEVALSGVPVVVLGRETNFDLNPLAWFSEFAPPAHTPQELRKQVLCCLNLSGAEREEMKKWARKFRESAISPINDKTITAFVKPRGDGDFISLVNQ
jgi:hypothetical protein